jgi:C-terminal processing protease CtpA/Prc
LLDQVEGQLVVTTSANKALEPGDIVVAIDGVESTKLFAQEETLISGSPQWRRVSALQQLGYGPAGSSMRITIRRGGTDLTVSVERVDRRVARQQLHEAIERLDDGYYYVDLSRASMTDIEKVIDALAASPGVVFDLRGRPNSNHEILSHLLTVPDATNWMAIPLIVRPGSAGSPAAWQRSGWNLPVVPPHIRGRVAFMTGPRAISYSESVMGLVEHYHLGEIVGERTAGTNGDIAQITSPTGCDTIFTGRLVTKPDGSRHYLQGISPTIPATRTVVGVSAGRDEVLERALAYVRGASH